MGLLDRLGFGRTVQSARIGALGVRDALQVANLHAQGGFARGWAADECAALIADASVTCDGSFTGSSVLLDGFILSRRAADEAEILTIAVSQKRRRGGHGKALLGAHLARLASLGAKSLFLEVEAGNAPALALYRRFGFVEVGRREAYYPMPDGTRAAALVMRRELS
ncbi:MAG: GNAT family N-acetyltransferase [Bosea sp. (in: a-proteobacteria)]